MVVVVGLLVVVVKVVVKVCLCFSYLFAIGQRVWKRWKRRYFVLVQVRLIDRSIDRFFIQMSR